MPHLLALNKMSECDIIIGKILPNIGWFGKFELEGMALGKPVIAMSRISFLKNIALQYIELQKILSSMT